ncbi:RDD family protein [Fluviibacterium sp. DFM31]|uniref:RDD family protein n=1 Tax=Meridianimarinicoccus marinus TaxID=3231483 RepID=A0ABV3L5D6_9RHOB
MTPMIQPDTALWGLPDPDTHGDFYADTTIKRFFAWLVDTILILGLSLLAIPFTAFTGLFFFGFLFLAVGLVYRIWAMSSRSATPGMRLMAIEFRNSRGERFDTATATLHVLMFYFMTTFFVLQIISIILMLTSSRGQGLHDMLLGTAAINRSRKP